MDNDKYVKRVIGVAGDHVEIVDSVVSINGIALDEYYVNPAEAAAFFTKRERGDGGPQAVRRADLSRK